MREALSSTQLDGETRQSPVAGRTTVTTNESSATVTKGRKHHMVFRPGAESTSRYVQTVSMAAFTLATSSRIISKSCFDKGVDQSALRDFLCTMAGSTQTIGLWQVSAGKIYIPALNELSVCVDKS